MSCVSSTRTWVGTGCNPYWGFVSCCVWVYGKKEQVYGCKKKFGLTKTKAAKQQRREDDTSFILCTAVNSDDSLERKKRKKKQQRRWPTWWERKRGSAALVLVSIYGLSMYLSVVSSPQPPVEDSHWMREMYLTGGSALAYYFHVMWRAILGKQADACFSPLSLFSMNPLIYLHCTHDEHAELLARITHNLAKCVPPALQCCNTPPKIAFLIVLQMQYLLIYVW